MRRFKTNHWHSLRMSYCVVLFQIRTIAFVSQALARISMVSLAFEKVKIRNSFILIMFMFIFVFVCACILQSQTLLYFILWFSSNYKFLCAIPNRSLPVESSPSLCDNDNVNFFQECMKRAYRDVFVIVANVSCVCVCVIIVVSGLISIIRPATMGCSQGGIFDILFVPCPTTW